MSDDQVCESVDNAAKKQAVDTEEAQEIRFNPPLYIQRYAAVSAIVEQCHNDGTNMDQLLDVGCAECKFLKRAIQLPFLKSAYGLDIDRELLKQKSVCLEPLITDHLLKRKHDLHVKVFAGDIADHDPVMLDMDVVAAIEVIEHLHEPVLDAFVITVFSYIKPKLVILTTPNSEFNVLFSNFSGMRHWDHKFEWTREQFQNWCNSICLKYNYSVMFDGVGEPPPESASVGYCSQMAVFTLTAGTAAVSTGSAQYEQIFSTVYPGINKTDSEMFDIEIEYTLNTQSFSYIQENDVADLSQTPIPLNLLLFSNKTLFEQLDCTSLADRLEKLNYTLSKDRWSVIVDMQDPSSPLSSDDDHWLSHNMSKDIPEPASNFGVNELCWD